MERELFIRKFTELQEKLISYLQKEDDVDADFCALRHYLDQQKINTKNEGFIEFLHLISRISINHRRTPFFQTKIEKILISYKDDIKANFTNTYIFNIFKKNKLLLLFLFEEGIIKFDKDIQILIENNKPQLTEYFSPEIDQLKKAKKQSNASTELFQTNRKNGENQHQICKLIREDLIDDFVIYTNKNSINLASKIEPSIFETNDFLMKKNPTIIEYAAFFGSIQIIHYLRLNDIQLPKSLWFYAIHSNNAELIHLLEEYDDDKNVKMEYFKEAAKCHHNEIARYFINNYLQKPQKNYISKLIKYYNFEFIDQLIKLESLDLINSYFFDLCRYGYYTLVKTLLNDKSINLNHTKVFFINYFFIQFI
ncbi:hypothetical protein M9Y10_029459 [Tritrichomonas musculus]|uniref:DUF3447 domain-containing protein n=1 Tax=Tritrichomonas musculus TaxID=1915356 RepID=A0ABR2KNB1_9EUKA